MGNGNASLDIIVESPCPYDSGDQMDRDMRLVLESGQNPNMSDYEKGLALRRYGYTHLRGRQSDRIPVERCIPERICAAYENTVSLARKRLEQYDRFADELFSAIRS